MSVPTVPAFSLYRTCRLSRKQYIMRYKVHWAAAAHLCQRTAAVEQAHPLAACRDPWPCLPLDLCLSCLLVLEAGAEVLLQRRGCQQGQRRRWGEGSRRGVAWH